MLGIKGENMGPIFLKPIFKNRIWGGDRLTDFYDLEKSEFKIGEAWLISAHPNGPSVIESPKEFEGMLFDQFFDEYKEELGFSDYNEFPLLVKFLDAKEDLAVQVHPDDAYSLRYENELGKTECWYILEAGTEAEIIYGHYAESKEELEQLIRDEEWDKLLRIKQVKPGDFYYVPAGMIHAVGKDILALEIQQSSDVTYRLYDYDRVDPLGNKQDLHIEKSLDVITVPHEDYLVKSKIEYFPEATTTCLVSEKYFNVDKWQVEGMFIPELEEKAYLCTVIGGEGALTFENQVYELNLWDSFILPTTNDLLKVEGNIELVLTSVHS